MNGSNDLHFFLGNAYYVRHFPSRRSLYPIESRCERKREKDEDRDDKRAKSYFSRDISKMCLSIKINKKKKESLILKRKLLFTELKFFFKFQ